MCSSDPNATAGLFAAPISYRACTGDNPAGDNGAFAPGARSSLKEIQELDGTGYTAVFSERLVGNNQSTSAMSMNYMLVEGRIGGDGCGSVEDLARWRGDAGSSWFAADYRSTLYNHATTAEWAPFMHRGEWNGGAHGGFERARGGGECVVCGRARGDGDAERSTG